MSRTIRAMGMLAGVAMVLSVAACSSDDDGDSGDGGGSATATETMAGEATTVGVTLGKPQEIGLETDADSAPAGSVTFDITNEGALEHELVIAKTDLAADALPVDGAEVKEDELEIVDEAEGIAGGGDAELAVDLEPGSYVLFCNIPGHYQGGMRIAFTVE